MVQLSIDGRTLLTDFAIGVNIGDILQKDITGNVTRIGTLHQIIPDLSNYIHTTPGSNNSLVSSAQSSVQVNFNAGANVPNVAQGSMVVTFSQSDSVYYALQNVSYQQLDILPLEAQINTYWSQNNFFDVINRHKYLVVTTVLFADSGTFIYSLAANTQVQLTASGNVPVSGLNMALNGGLQVNVTKGKAQSLKNFGSAAGPLFQGMEKLIDGWDIARPGLLG